jgi:hypothetical protein
MRRAALIALFFAGSGLAAAAEPISLTGEALLTTVSGKTVLIDTPVGAVPVIFNADGTLAGHSKEVARYAAGVEHDTGKWWVSGDRLRLCQKWRSWLEGKLYCYTLRQEGPLLHWSRSDGEKGLARIAAQ